MTSRNRRLLKGGTYAFVAKILTAIASLATNFFLARLLSPSDLGVFFLLFNLLAFFSLVAEYGMRQTIVRLIAESLAIDQPGRARAALRLAFTSTLVGVAIVSGTYLLFLGKFIALEAFNSDALAGLVGMTAIWIGVRAFQEIIAESFRGLKYLGYAAAFSGAATTVSTGVVLAGMWFLRGGASLEGIVAWSVLIAFIVAVVAATLLIRCIKPLGLNGSIRWAEVNTAARSVFIAGLSALALAQSGMWVIGAFRSTEEIAMFGAASRLVALVITPLLIVNQIAQPFVAELYAKGSKGELQSLLRGLASLAGIPAICALLGFVFFGEMILTMIFGPVYANSYSILVVLSLGKFADVWFGCCGLTLYMTGNEKSVMKITLFSGLVTISLSVLAVSEYGAFGVACALALGMAMQNFLSWWVAYKKTGLFTHMVLYLKPAEIRSIFRAIVGAKKRQ